MNSGSYLSSVRVSSVLMLLAVYLDVDLARSQLERNNWLNEARHVYAVAYLGDPGELASKPPQEVLGVGTVIAEKLPQAGRKLSRSEEILLSADRVWVVRVTRADGRQWRATVYRRDLIEPRKDLSETLQRIAAALGLKDADKADNSVLVLFRAIERDSADRKVTVPGVDLAFRPDIAPWVIAFVTLGFLLLMRNQLARVLMDEDLALTEPWIVVDGGKGMERLVAGGWLLAIWAAPWVAGGCLLAVFSSQIIVDGAVTTWPREVLACGASLLLVLVGGWASLTATSDLLQLRRLRQARLDHVRRAAAAP